VKPSVIVAALLVAGVSLIIIGQKIKPAPGKTETLSCVRVKQVTPAGAINYLCEVRK